MNWKWPFAAPAREEKSGWPLVALSAPRAASWGSREAGALTRDGYLGNAVAYRSVRMAAEAAAETASAGFLEALYTDLLLTGNAFVEAVRLPGRRPLPRSIR